MCSVIDFETSSVQGVVDQQGWRDASVQDDVCCIVPRSKGEPVLGGSSRSTFLAKRSVLRTKHQYSIEKPQEKYSTP
jgi:hypothetical protein